MKLSPLLLYARPTPHWAMVALLLASGCDSQEPCKSAAPYAGIWAYEAVETAGAGRTWMGTFRIDDEACPDLRGAADLVEIRQGGERRRLTGPVFGTAIEGDVQLDFTLEGVSVEHAAQFSAGKLTGDWIQVVRGEIVATGTFAATFNPQP